MIEDEDFKKLLEIEQALSGIRSLAGMVAEYYQTLRASKVPARESLVLTQEFQISLLARQFSAVPPKDA